jgi:hypothetical protein
MGADVTILRSVDEKVVAGAWFKTHVPFHFGNFSPCELHWCERERKPRDSVEWIQDVCFKECGE